MVRMPHSTLAHESAGDSPPRFSVTPRPGGGLCLHGELDLATIPRLEAAFRAQRQRDDVGLVVDVSDLDYSSCAGLAVLVVENRRRRAVNSTFLLIAPTGGLRRSLALTGVDTALNIRPAGATAA